MIREYFLALGWFLEEINVTWARLEKKRTRLQLDTKSLEEIIIQTVEMASPTLAKVTELDQDSAQAKRLFGNEKVWVEMHRGIAWDKVENPKPQSTPQVLPSFKVYTPPVTYPKEVEETIGIPMEVEPLDHTKLEELGLNTCSHDIFLSSREIPSVDEPEPQLLPNFSPLDVNL
ncbi:hypothetical protein Tco_1547027 [Tanacetum coccineum]